MTSAFQYVQLLHVRVVLGRVAGDVRLRRPLRIDQRRALLRVFFRKQPGRRHRHEGRVRVVAVAIRIRELHRLDDGVEVVGARVAHRGQVEVLEDVERLEQHRALAPERVLVDRVAAVRGRRGLFDARKEVRKVRPIERRVVLLQERDHLARDVPLVETVARRDHAGPSSSGFRGALGADHPGQRVRQRRQPDGFAGLVVRPVGLQPDRLVAGPSLEELALTLDGIRGPRPQRKALRRVCDGRSGHLLEAHRPPLFEHRQGRVHGARDDGGVQPFAAQRLLARQIPVDVDRPRRPALADDRRHFLFLSRVDQHERFPAEAVEILLHDAAGEQRRNAGIEGVAAFEEDAECRGRRQRMACRDAGRWAHHRGPQRGRARLRIRRRHLPGADRGRHQSHNQNRHSDHVRAHTGHHDTSTMPDATTPDPAAPITVQAVPFTEL